MLLNYIPRQKMSFTLLKRTLNHSETINLHTHILVIYDQFYYAVPGPVNSYIHIYLIISPFQAHGPIFPNNYRTILNVNWLSLKLHYLLPKYNRPIYIKAMFHLSQCFTFSYYHSSQFVFSYRLLLFFPTTCLHSVPYYLTPQATTVDISWSGSLQTASPNYSLNHYKLSTLLLKGF